MVEAYWPARPAASARAARCSVTRSRPPGVSVGRRGWTESTDTVDLPGTGRHRGVVEGADGWAGLGPGLAPGLGTGAELGHRRDHVGGGDAVQAGGPRDGGAACPGDAG